MSPRSASWEGSRPGSGVGGRRGPAFALHGAVLARARADAREALTRWVLRTNARGRAFYERQGWRPDGVEHRKPFRDVLLDEVRYLRSV